MPSTLDLTTAAEAASVLGVSASAPRLAALITAASELIRDYVGAPLHRRTGVVEGVAGGASRLFLRAVGVQAIASISVYEEEREADTYELEDSEKGIILSLCGPWPFTGRLSPGVAQQPFERENTGDILVTYSAGWVTPGQAALDNTLTRDLPHVFEQACLMTVTNWYRALGRDTAVQSRSLGDASVTYGPSASMALPREARDLVRRYRKTR